MPTESPLGLGNTRGAVRFAWGVSALVAIAAWAVGCGEPHPPVATGRIPALTVEVGNTGSVDLAGYFSDADGDILIYTAGSSDPGVATVAVSGATVRVTAVAAGNATVTVTASDPGGLSAEQTFAVAVPNRAPEAVGSIADAETHVGESFETALAGYFSDPDGDALTYAATSTDSSIAGVSVSGATLRVAGVGQGAATVAVAASDPGGLSATQTFSVAVPNRAPEAVGQIDDAETFVGESFETALAGYFSDPDGDALAYAATSTDSSIAGVSVSGATLRVAGVGQGAATVAVTASDPGGLSATQAFSVTVPNRAPEAVGQIDDAETFVGESFETALAGYFGDPDGDALAYAATSTDSSIAGVSVSGATLRVAGVGQGAATVAVTASDPGGLSATQAFSVTVPNRAPEAVGQIDDAETFVGESFETALAGYFGDPDGDALAYAATSTDSSIAGVSVSGATLRVAGVGQGAATVAVTASDPGGLSATQTFSVAVPNRAPEAVGQIDDAETFVGESFETALAGYFGDPDGDALTYAATSTDSGIASVSVSGGVLRVVGVGNGTATVTATASDAGGLSATQTFSVTVPNRAPEPVGSIDDAETYVGESVDIALAGYFSEPDGEALAYGAVSSNTATATVTMAGATVTVVAVAKGTATVTVMATDPGGLAATQTFEVTVPNRGPEAGDPIPDVEAFVGDEELFDASGHFSDPDGDVLAYAVATSAGGVARVSVSGGVVRVDAVGQGSATVTVTATDPEGLSAESSFEVTVPNRGPEAGDPIPDVEAFVGDEELFDASGHFSDPDGDVLAYAVATSAGGVARVSVSGGVVRVEAAGQGSATVTVTATDPGGLVATQTFEVTVPNRGPEAGDPIPDVEAFVGDEELFDASGHFSDPDGDVLAYAVATSAGGVARVSVSGGVVRVEAAGQGSATVTVTATDPEGLSAESSFEVTVPNRGPEAGDPIPDVEAFVGDEELFDASGHFSDPDGDVLAYAVATSAGGVARVSVSGGVVRVEAAGQGSATVTVTATDPEGLSAESSFEVTVPNRGPEAGDPIPDVEAFVGDEESFDASGHFSDPDGDVLAYAVATSAGGVARVSVSGGVVRVEAAGQGSATVTVTATDPGGLAATQTFEVTVPNRGPEAGDPIPDIEAFVGDEESFDASGHFSDPDGDVLAYAVATSAGGVARVSVSGGVVRVEAAGQGSATVTVTATDPGGLAATQTFEVTVPNRGPEAGDPIPDVEAFVGDEESFDASGHFSDPDGDVLAYAVATSAGGVARVSVSGGVVRVEAAGQGTATVTVMATDPGGLAATQTFEVTVPNRGPEAGDPIPDIEAFVGDEESFDASGHFSDPDGDVLAYAVATSAGGVARVSVSGGVVRVEAAGQGSATVTVTATDPGGLAATQTFEVTVPNRGPEAGDPIPDVEAFVGDEESFDASGHFSDPDGDVLAYAVATSAVGVARVSVSGGVVRVEAAGQGSATVTVTATDPGGLAATQTFEVTVPNRGPEAGDPIPDVEAFVGDEESFDASGHFSDPDGDVLAYAVATSAVGVARVSVSGGVVRVEAAGQGSATVTVTATDPGGLAATQTFEVTVPNRGPEAGAKIKDMKVAVDASEVVDLSSHFSDPDGDALTYSVTSSSPSRVEASVSGSTLTVKGLSKGSAKVTVTATDAGGLATTQSFEVTLPSRAPEAGDPIPDMEAFVGDEESFDASGHFSDPDGDPLTYAVATSAGGVARVSVSGSVVRVEAAGQGTATVTVTATDPDGLSAESSFVVTVPNRAPKAVGTIADVEVDASEVVDIADNFSDPDGDALTYSVTSSSPSRVEASVSGGVVTVVAVAKGTATVTVTATDPEGLSAESSFVVTVPNRAPEAGDPIPDIEVFVGDAESFDASGHFSDPDGDALTYSVTSSSPSKVEVSVSGSTLTVKGLSKGNAKVTVTATDPGGLAATRTFEATVPNRAPEAGDPIPDIEVFVGDAESFDASGHFSDPDGDVLAYAVATSAGGVARVSVSGGVVRVEAAGQGSATVTVTATDPGGLAATRTFEVTVPNRAPEAVGTIADVEVAVNASEVVDLSDHFSDPDGDALTYAVTSSSPSKVEVSVSGSTLTVKGLSKGDATVTATARDSEGLTARQTFEVFTVPNRAPEAGDPIPDIEVFVGGEESFDASGHFSDPDGDALAYAVATSAVGVARVSVSGGVVSVEAAGKGTATVTVTATDPEGLSAESTFEVTVPNRAPEAVGTIADVEVEVDASEVVDIADNFSDPDGDALTYSVTSSSPSRVEASVSGSTLTVKGLSKGGAKVTATARDSEGLTARQTFEVTVPNRAPEALVRLSEEVSVGDAVSVDASSYFSDPDGDALTYSATSSSPSTVSVSVSGAVVTVVALAKGTATVTMTATDTDGLSAESSFVVRVPNRAPEVGAAIGNLTVDASEVVDIADNFSDPDGDTLTYSATSSSPSTVSVSVSGAVVTVVAVVKGTATVTVTATDPEDLSAESSFVVTVPNRAPEAAGTIADVEVEVDASEVVDIADNFSDPDGDALTYSVTSSSPSRVEASVSGSTLTVKGLSKGDATVTATARDSEGLTARQTFEVTVPNRAPKAGAKIKDIRVYESNDSSVDASGHFSDPDGDALTYSATSSSPSTVSVSVSGAVVTVVGVAKGTATVTVTAQDTEGLTARGTFVVLVRKIPPWWVLANLYHDTDGPNWINSEHWLSRFPLRMWYGVQTNHSNDVVSISLAGYWDSDSSSYVRHGLSGPIHRAVAYLPKLKRLDLSINSLTGVIPSELGTLSELDSLNLWGNSLTGAIPSELGDLSNLKYLNLWGNSLTGAIPSELGDLSELEILSLGDNSLTGAIPSELGDLSNLEYLYLGSNSLTGAIPPELGDLSNLKYLYLRSNSLTGAIPSELGDLSSLEHLDLWGNSLTGAIPPELGDLSNLKSLYLRSNSLTGAIPSELGDLSNLEYLDLWHNSLTGAIPSELGDLSNLKSLVLSDNSLTGAIPSELGDLSNLNILLLDDNLLTGALPNSFLSLELDVFWFDDNNGLCAPNTSSFTSWLDSIGNRRGPRC